MLLTQQSVYPGIRRVFYGVFLYENSPSVIFNGTFSFPQMSVENVAFEALNSVVSRQSMGKPMINKSLITPAVTELFFQGTN